MHTEVMEAQEYLPYKLCKKKHDDKVFLQIGAPSLKYKPRVIAV